MRTVRILFASLFVLLSSHTSFAKTLFVVPTSPEPAQVSILTGTVTSPNLPKVVLSRPWISADSGHYSVRVPINGVQYRIRAVGPNTLDVSTAWRGSVEKKAEAQVVLTKGRGSFILVSETEAGKISAEATVQITLVPVDSLPPAGDSYNIDWGKTVGDALSLKHAMAK